MLRLVEPSRDHTPGTTASAIARRMKDDDARRLAILRRYEILDTPPEAAFDRITALAASLFSAPMSIISFLDGDRLWFKSHHGLDAPEVSWSPQDAVEPRIRRAFDLGFFVGVPLTTHDGWNLGTLCVIDRQRRRVDEDHIHHLMLLANIAMDLLELRLSRRRADARVEVMAGVADHRAVNSPQLIRAVTLGAQTRFANLTPRQREIMELVVAGYPSKIIAAKLRISRRTVESHRAAIMKKTGAKSLPALARLALCVAGIGARELLDLTPSAATAASNIAG